MTIQRPSADDLIQTRLAATRHLAQSPEGSVSPEGFAWSQSYRQDVTALLARLSVAEQERDDAREDTAREHELVEYWAGRAQAAEARVEAAERQVRLLLEANARANARVRAALAGREETGGG